MFKSDKWIKILYITPAAILGFAFLMAFLPALLNISFKEPFSTYYVMVLLAVLALFQICAAMFGILGILINVMRIIRKDEIAQAVMLIFVSGFYLLAALAIFYVGAIFTI